MKMRDIVFHVLGFITGAIATVAFLYLMRVVTVEAIEKRTAELREAIERMEQPQEDER
jgi:uncharacterized membrane protein (DUF106 family)